MFCEPEVYEIKTFNILLVFNNGFDQTDKYNLANADAIIDSSSCRVERRC